MKLSGIWQTKGWRRVDRLVRRRMLSIEIQIQLQNIDARLSEHAELPCHGVFGNKSMQFGLVYVARARL